MAVASPQTDTNVLDEITSLFTNKLIREIVDSQFGSFVTMDTIMGWPGIKRSWSGGDTIQVPVNLATPARADALATNFSTFDTTKSSTRTAPTFVKATYVSAITVSMIEASSVRSPEGFTSLLERETRLSVQDLKDRFNKDIYGDGTRKTGIIVGWALAIDDGPSTGTYGNVSRVNNSSYRNIATNQAATSANVLADWRTCFTSCTSGRKQPRVIFVGRTVWNVLHSKLTATLRTDPVANRGAGGGKIAGDPAISSLWYNGAEIIMDEDVVGWGTNSSVAVMVNPDSFGVYVVEGWDMQNIGTVRPKDQLVEIGGIALSCALVCDEPRRNGVIYDHATA